MKSLQEARISLIKLTLKDHQMRKSSKHTKPGLRTRTLFNAQTIINVIIAPNKRSEMHTFAQNYDRLERLPHTSQLNQKPKFQYIARLLNFKGNVSCTMLSPRRTVLHCVLLSPFFSSLVVFLTICFVCTRDIRTERIIRIWVGQKGAYRQ